MNYSEIVYAYMHSATTNNEIMSRYARKLLMILFSVKHFSWNYENEYRILKFTEDEYIQMKASKIYIGYNCSNEYKNKLIKYGIELGCKVYLMQNSVRNKTFNLKVKRVN